MTPPTRQAAPGRSFRAAPAAEWPLQIVGTINANHALLARRAGYRAICVSGGGVAAGSPGLPEPGVASLDDVLTDVRRITDVCDPSLLVDIDTGFGPGALNIVRTVGSLAKAGAAACHIDDQIGARRCVHRPGKDIVSRAEMADRVKAAADAKTASGLVLIVRTAVHGGRTARQRCGHGAVPAECVSRHEPRRRDGVCRDPARRHAGAGAADDADAR